MTNKADIQTQINTIDDGGNNSASEVRNVFGTHADSILEAIYSTSVSDDEATGTYTTSNANFNYDLTFRKVGSSVTLTGRFTANASLSGGSFTILTITDTTLTQDTTASYYESCVKLNSSDTLPVILTNNNLVTSASILSGEGFRFTIKYNSEN